MAEEESGDGRRFKKSSLEPYLLRREWAVSESRVRIFFRFLSTPPPPLFTHCLIGGSVCCGAAVSV